MEEKLIRADSLLDQIKSPYTEYPIMIGIRKAIKEMIDEAPTVDAIPVDYIWQRAEWYEKQWLEEDNHWCKNVAEALRALLEDWDGEVGGILDKYE